LRVFLIRAVIAVAWAVVFTAVANSLTTSVTVVAGVLLVLYRCSPGTVNPITRRREDFVGCNSNSIRRHAVGRRSVASQCL
jgi:hypothetical protein